MAAHPLTKVAKVFEGSLLIKGQRRPAKTPDWNALLARVKELPFESRTVGDIVYDPVETPSGWALSMHKPINRSYKSIVDAGSGAVEDWLADDATSRFAYSTAVVFLGRGATFAICKGEHQSPGHPDMEVFLKHFVEPQEAGAHWAVSAVLMPGESARFNEVSRATSLDLTMTTRADLFTEGTRGQGAALDAVLSTLADAVGADLQVRMHISIEKAQRSQKTEQGLHRVISKAQPWIESSGSRAIVTTQDSGGVKEALNLVTHDLAVEIVLPPESTERQSFRDILNGLVAEVGYLNERVAQGGA